MRERSLERRGEQESAASSRRGWLSLLRHYLLAIAAGNLIWEFAQLPLYTIWRTGTPGEIVFAAVHCTGGDILIAGAALVIFRVDAAGTAAWLGDGAAGTMAHRSVSRVLVCEPLLPS